MGRFLLLTLAFTLAVWAAAFLRRQMRAGSRPPAGRVIEGRFRVLGEGEARGGERGSARPPPRSR